MKYHIIGTCTHRIHINHPISGRVCAEPERRFSAGRKRGVVVRRQPSSLCKVKKRISAYSRVYTRGRDSLLQMTSCSGDETLISAPLPYIKKGSPSPSTTASAQWKRSNRESINRCVFVYKLSPHQIQFQFKQFKQFNYPNYSKLSKYTLSL